MTQITVMELEIYLKKHREDADRVFEILFGKEPYLRRTFERGFQDDYLCTEYQKIPLHAHHRKEPLSVQIRMAAIRETKPNTIASRYFTDFPDSETIPVFIGSEKEITAYLDQPEVSDALFLVKKPPVQVRVPCKNGTLVAEAGGDPSYPEIFTYLERPDCSQVDLVAAGADLPGQEDGSHNGGIHAYLYGDTARDDWTRRYLFTEKELNTD